MTAWLLFPLALQVLAVLASPVPGGGNGNGHGHGNGHGNGNGNGNGHGHGHGHVSKATLAQAALAAGKLYYGTEISSYYMANTTFSEITNSEFNQITPENEMKWEVIQPERNTFNWTGTDLVGHHAITRLPWKIADEQVIAQARKQGAYFRGHNFCWNSQT